MSGSLSDIRVKTLGRLGLVEFKVDLLVAGGPWADLLIQLVSELDLLKSLVAKQNLSSVEILVARMITASGDEIHQKRDFNIETLKLIVELIGSIRLLIEVSYRNIGLGLVFDPSKVTWRDLMFTTNSQDPGYYRELLCREAQRRLKIRDAAKISSSLKN